MQLQLPRSLPRAMLVTGLLVLPAGLLWQPDFANEILTLLALSGLFFLLCGEIGAEEWASTKLFSLLLLGFFLSCALAVVAAQDDFAGFDRLRKYQHFLFAPLVALAFVHSKVSPGVILAAAKIGAMAAGLLALVQYVQTAGRAGGEVNALVFGCLAQLLGFFSLLRYPLESVSVRLISLSAFAFGGLAAVLSQSRGSWVAAPLLLLTILLIWRRAGLLSRRILLEVGGYFVLLVLIAASTPIVQQRVSGAIDGYRAFAESRQWSSSVGQRLMMWDGGLAAAGKHLLLGWGPHQTQQAAVAELDNPRLRQTLLQYRHLHNEYITILVAQGMVGLAGLLLMLFVPLQLFIKCASDPGQLIAAGSGALLCTGYALQGLSNLAFGHDVMNAFFVFFLSFALPATMLQKHRVTHAAADRRLENNQPIP